jgi:hypothetical protein
MAEIIYDLVLPSLLTGYIREVPIPAIFNLNQYLPDREIHDIEAMWDVVTRTNRAAKFRAYDAETPIGKRDSMTRSRVVLPPVGEKRVLTEYERLQLERLRGGNNLDRLIEQLYADEEANVRAIRARMELARGDVLSDGKFTLTGENGLTLEADFGIAGNHIVAPGVLWSDHANATPLIDYWNWVQQYILDCGEPPGVVVTGRTTVAHMLQNQSIRQIAATVVGTPAQISRQQLNQTLDAYMLPPLVVQPYDTLVDVDGVSTRPIAANKFVMLPQNPSDLGYTAWGITAEALELAALPAEQGGIALRDAPGVVGVVMKDSDPVRTWTKAAAVGMPIITDPRRLMVATVF